MQDSFVTSAVSLTSDFYRDTWWKNIGIPSKTDPRRKKFVSYFFTGSKEEFSNKDQVDLEELLGSPGFQNEFCNFLIHTSIYG